MELRQGSERVIAKGGPDAVKGAVRWAPAKSLWFLSMFLSAAVAGPPLVSWSAVTLFLVSSAITLCFGHSVGMHRRLIHSSFQCPRWLEYLCVFLGTLVGMAGPIGMNATHDFRDWAQRKAPATTISAIGAASGRMPGGS